MLWTSEQPSVRENSVTLHCSPSSKDTGRSPSPPTPTNPLTTTPSTHSLPPSSSLSLSYHWHYDPLYSTGRKAVRWNTSKGILVVSSCELRRLWQLVGGVGLTRMVVVNPEMWVTAEHPLQPFLRKYEKEIIGKKSALFFCFLIFSCSHYVKSLKICIISQNLSILIFFVRERWDIVNILIFIILRLFVSWLYIFC